MKKIKVLLIAVLALSLSLCLFACTKTHENEKYTAYEITKVDMAQKTTNEFAFTLKCDIAPSSSAKVYITRYDRIDEGTESIAYENKDGDYSFSATVPYDSYFIHVVDGEKTATLPMARPRMAPTLSVSDKSAVLTYNFVNGTSWSSFCDPTGKSVYKSAKKEYDETATLVARNVNIFGVDTTTDYNYSADTPYYYVVLSAKNGIVTYASAPLMTINDAFSDLKVSMSDESGTPTLTVSGKFVTDGDVALEFYSADSKLGNVIETVGERKAGKAGDSFKVSLDMREVLNGTTGAGIWYDIKLATSSGSLYELSSDVADMSQTLKNGNATFEFKEWNKILKLNYQYYDYDVERVEIIERDGVPTLVVTGTYDTSLREIKLHADVEINGKKDHLYWDNKSTESGKFRFEAPLTDITYESQPWAWFHIYTYKGNASVNTGSGDLPRGDLLKIGQTFTYDGVTYTVKAYQGTGSQLAIEAMKQQ